MNLFLIPARGGSKGLPEKNIKIINQKPLIIHALDFASNCKETNDIIFLSTDNLKIKQTAENFGYEVPFLRPKSLATDESSTFDVIMHVINEYGLKQIYFEKIILLQPTTPFRNKNHFKEMMKMFDKNTDMVVSVIKSKQNPYFNLFEENYKGFLELSKKSNFKRRQDCPDVYQYNGSIYIIDVKALTLYKEISKFTNIKKYEMTEEYSIDIDTEIDFKLAELILDSFNGKI